MARPQKDPLRTLTAAERTQLEKISRSLTLGAAQVSHAKELLAVAAGATFTQAASLAGHKCGDTVAHLVSRFNKAGLSALQIQHAGGPALSYGEVQRARVLREFRRAPDRGEDGTAKWSLATLQRTLRQAEDGLAKIGTETIWKILHQAGYSWQKDRSWCETGKVKRVRKSGVVEVTDPDTLAKKN